MVAAEGTCNRGYTRVSGRLTGRHVSHPWGMAAGARVLGMPESGPGIAGGQLAMVRCHSGTRFLRGAGHSAGLQDRQRRGGGGHAGRSAAAVTCACDAEVNCARARRSPGLVSAADGGFHQVAGGGVAAARAHGGDIQGGGAAQIVGRSTVRAADFRLRLGRYSRRADPPPP